MSTNQVTSETNPNEKLTKRQLIVVRNFNPPTDMNFIYSTWLKGLYHGNDLYNMIDKDIYFHKYHAVIDQLLSRPGVAVKVACLKDDSEVILGYAVLEHKTLHWVFVKPVWREIGIAKDLVPDTTEQVTHITKIGKSILNKHKKVKFNPFL